MNQKIRVRAKKSGSIRNVTVEITDCINSNGVQSSSAEDSHGNTYSIVDRDYTGPIWEKD